MKLQYASSEIENAFTRHRAMGRKLRDVEAIESDLEDIPLIEEDEA